MLQPIQLLVTKSEEVAARAPRTVWATLLFPARHGLPKASRNSASEVRCVREEKIEEVLAIPRDSSSGDNIVLYSLSPSLQIFVWLSTSAYFPCE